MKSTLILAAALVASVAAAPSYNGGSQPGSNYDAAKPAPAPGSNYDAAKPAPGYNGNSPAVTTPCTASSAAAAKPTTPANSYDGGKAAPAPVPTGAYEGGAASPKKPCTTAVADAVAAPSTTPCDKSGAAKTTDAYEQAAPAQPTGAYDAKPIKPAGQQEQQTDGSLYQASSASKVAGGSVVALMVAGAGLLAF